MGKIFYYLEYLGLKLLLNTLALLPEKWLIPIGEKVGLLITKLMPKRYKRSISDIQKTFPKKTLQECQKIAKESWQNIGRITVEFAKTTKLPKEEVIKKIHFIDTEKLFADNHKGQGGILHLGHFANWEVLGLVATLKAKKMAFVALPQNNLYVDKYICNLRSTFGSKMISSYNPFFACFRALKKGYLIAILSDQSVGSSKLYMNFLDRPAEVGPMTALLSLKANVPVYCIDTYREDNQIIAKCTETIYPPQVQYDEQVLYDYTKLLKGKLEDYIIKHPQDWLWAHNRWKRQDECKKAMDREQLHGR